MPEKSSNVYAIRIPAPERKILEMAAEQSGVSLALFMRQASRTAAWRELVRGKDPEPEPHEVGT